MQLELACVSWMTCSIIHWGHLLDINVLLFSTAYWIKSVVDRIEGKGSIRDCGGCR